MKKIFKIVLPAFMTTLMLSSGTLVKNLRSELPVNSNWAIRDDTSNLMRLVGIDSFKLLIIPPSSGVQFYKDKIVFLSMSKNERKMSPNQISFGAVEAYEASVDDSVTGRHMIFSSFSSFSYPCEAMTFSRDYNTVYFSKYVKKDKKEKIFKARFTPNGKSQKDLIPESLPLDFCNDNFNYSHPALSSDENTLIFASDRKGSFGGMDLFMSRLTGGKWSVPENLGKLINTAGNEFFPFLDSDNNLFFSSDGLPGYGGYDIFTCKFNGAGWDKPVNLSDHINSDKDDIAFTINKLDGKSAFLTRRPKSTPGEMQLYRVTLKQEVADRNLLTLSYVFDGKPVPMTGIIATIAATEVKPPETESKKLMPDTATVKKEAEKVSDKTVSSKKVTEKVAVTRPEPGGKPPEAKIVTIKPTKPVPVEQKDVVIYRVQFLATTRPKTEKEITINGKRYNLYEFFYLGAYRYAVGEFTKLPPAIELQRICRQSGYSQAFVAAFKNNTRSLDLKLFK